MVERITAQGGTVLALIEPSMQSVWRKHAWSATREGQLVAGCRPNGASTVLHRETAARCIMRGEELPSGVQLPSYIVVDFEDGCPANCLAHNLRPVLVDPRFEKEWQNMMHQCNLASAAKVAGRG